MSQYLPELLTIATIHILALLAPGPDFILVTKNSLVHSRRIGMYTALGIALGVTVHVAYSLIGIGLVISQSIVLFSIIKYLGAGYLLYIGWKSLRSQSHTEQSALTHAKNEISPLRAIRMGFFTNVLNPKVTLFFLGIFTQVIDPLTPLSVQLLYGIEITIMSFVLWSLIAALVSHRAIKCRFVRIQHRIEQAMGAILILLGIKVALLHNK